ncbi:MAG: YccF domain-containing protein [Candidatus Izemoplasmatales bacterium]
MRLIGNILWFIIVGLLSFVWWIIVGLLWCVTIIGIPFGTQCFKIASLAVFPFGKTVHTNFDSHPVANVIWLIFFGWEITISYVIIGVILSITIIGIPFGKQCFKLASLSLLPFGAEF